MYLIQTVQSTWRPQLPLPKELQIADEQRLQNDDDGEHDNDNNKYKRIQAANNNNNSNNNKITNINDFDEIIQLDSDMERLRKDNNNSSLSGSTQLTNKQKWSFGRLFRKKKEIETETSSEEDRKAGFLPAQKLGRNGAQGSAGGGGGGSGGGSGSTAKSKGKHKTNRSSKMIGAGFDHIVVSPKQQQQQQHQQPPHHIDNEFFLPVETIAPTEPIYQNQQQQQQQQKYHVQQQQQQQQQAQQQPQQFYSRSTNSLDRRALARGIGVPTPSHKSRSAQRLPHGGAAVTVAAATHSSEEEEPEIISLNSSTFSKYRSDESIHSGGQALSQPGQSRRSRAARNERYYKRLSRDGEQSHGQVPVMYAQPPVQRWKTQPVPLSIFQMPQQSQQQQQQRMPMQQQQQQHQRLRNTSSLQNVAPQYVQWNQMQQQLAQQQQQQQQQQRHQQPAQLTQSKGLQNSMQHDGKRSISYDSQIHLQNMNGRMHSKPLPPPPPPRDPLRRVNVSAHSLQNGSSASDLRPVSYAFDQCGVPLLPSGGGNSVQSSVNGGGMNSSSISTVGGGNGMGGRCVSDDRIWQPQTPHYQSVHSLNIQSSQQPTPSSRRFITRAERDANPAKKSLPNGIDFQYVADATPRSRKPIHMMDTPTTDNGRQSHEPPSSGILRTSKSGLPTPSVGGAAQTPASSAGTAASKFWQRLDDNAAERGTRGRQLTRASTENYQQPQAKPRSISSSRVSEFRSYPIPMYSEVQKPKAKPQQQPNKDELDNVICGSLHIKPGANNADNYVEIRHKDLNKSNSMPHHYQRRSGEVISTPNKYDEYVAEKREQHAQVPLFVGAANATSTAAMTPSAPQQKPNGEATPPIYFPRKKPANLEEAINELEAIYKSLGLAEVPEKKRERVPTPSDFEKFALAHADEYDDEDSPTGEPDPVRDDVAFRNLQLANLQHKSSEKQPPFGIPIGPIVPAPSTDYLHVAPEKVKQKKKTGSPDIVTDDLAVRALRKEPPGPKQHFIYPAGALQKKHRATRTQSANIYNLIQRDAAKPSGGDLFSYMELTRNIDRAGSMSDLHKTEEKTRDIPATLDLLRKLKAQDKQDAEEEQQQQQQQHASKKPHIPFRHPSQGGAISQLPERLTSTGEAPKAPVPLPRTSLTPEPHLSGGHQIEDALNKIALDAQESSIKLSKELQELRKEALITAARPKLNAEEQKLEQELQEIEAVSEAAKRCGKMLLDTLPDAHESEKDEATKPTRKLHKEGKLIKAIDKVSEAANAVCEKILKDIVTTEPPVVVQEAIKVKQSTNATQPPPVPAPPAVSDQPLVMPTLIKKLDPSKSERIEAIAKRCMRQLSQLADESADYDNLAEANASTASTTEAACNMPNKHAEADAAHKPQTTFISTVAEVHRRPPLSGSKAQTIEEIDKIMQECEAQARSGSGSGSGSSLPGKHKHSDLTSSSISAGGDDQRTTAPSMTSSSGSAAPNASTTASSFSSSSDCLAKSSSPTNASRRQSSSITSFNPYSSSDYIKSPSSEYHALSTDPIKTFSTTSYDVQSTTSATPNITSSSTANTAPSHSTYSYTPSPSPPLNLTPVTAKRSSQAVERARSSSPSQYNSSEELAMIFGIEEKPKQRRRQTVADATFSQQNTGKEAGVGTHDALLSSLLSPSSNPTSTKIATISSAAATTNPNVATASAATFVALNAPEQALTTTNPAFSVDVTTTTTSSNNTDIDTDTDTNTVTATTTSSPTNASNCSSNHSFKLATIHESEEEPKLSPNFNRIYASKIRIVVDMAPMDAVVQPPPATEECTAMPALAPITQFDSLSSLEEVSSNPDSGNVSLADFPLVAHANASLQLQTSYNTRFEVRERYVSEVSICADTSLSSASPQSVESENGEFPRLPTEEELLESLREEKLTGTTDEHDTSELDESLAKTHIDLTETSLESENDFELMHNELEIIELTDSDIDDAINEIFTKIESEEEQEGYSTEEEVIEILDSSVEALSESEPDESESLLLPTRRKSIIFETPQLNLNITELKLNYDNEPENEHNNVSESSHECVEYDEDEHDDHKLNNKQLNETTQGALNDNLRRRKVANTSNEGTLQRLPFTALNTERQNIDNDDDDDDVDDDERPSTSAKALSVFGETRSAPTSSSLAASTGFGGAMRAAAQEMTTLEHVFVACTMGMITPNDLLTLFLIIIGVIIIIAIALS